MQVVEEGFAQKRIDALFHQYELDQKHISGLYFGIRLSNR